MTLCKGDLMTEFGDGPSQESKPTPQHSDQQGNNTKLIKMKGGSISTHTPPAPHTHIYTHGIFVNSR